VDSRSIGEWTVECWKWVCSLPPAENPHLNCDDRWVTNHQPEGIVFFVAPLDPFHPPANECDRTFAVPENKFLLFPLLPVTADDFATDPPLTVPELTDALGTLLQNVDLHASFDGRPQTNLFAHRPKAPAFSYYFPSTNNTFSHSYGSPIVGLMDPIVLDGYWLMYEPLTPGTHVIVGGGAIVGRSDIHNNTIANITVIRVPLTKWIDDFLPGVKRAAMSAEARSELVNRLNRARDAFGPNNTGTTGVQHLLVFQQRVREMVEPTDAALAAQLIDYSGRIIARARRLL